MKILLLLLLLFINLSVHAEQIRICTQNLYNFGFYDDVQKRKKKSQSELNKQLEALTARFIQANCDIIAVQEVISNDVEEAENVLRLFSTELKLKTKKNFEVVSGKANDWNSKLGFIYDSKLFKKTFSRSYADTRLPKLNRYDKNRLFSRGPLRLDLKTNTNKVISLFNFHFKSRASYYSYDSSGYKFEIDRIQMSQALREIVLESKKNNPENIFVLLGDRNSLGNSASGKTLSGELDLIYFKHNLCKISQNGNALCPDHVNNQQSLVKLTSNDPDIDNKKLKLIDEILIHRKDLKRVLETKKSYDDYNVGILKADKKASDHPLLWLELEI